MANIASVTINTMCKYKKLSELLGITFEEGVTYLIQNQQPVTYIVSATEPTGGGFYIKDCTPFAYTPSSDGELWVRTVFYSTINVAR